MLLITDNILYSKGSLVNVSRDIDTAYRIIRVGENVYLSNISDLIHFHTVDTNGIIDDHGSIGNVRVKFGKILTDAIRKKLTDAVTI